MCILFSKHTFYEGALRVKLPPYDVPMKKMNLKQEGVLPSRSIKVSLFKVTWPLASVLPFFSPV